jgi:3-phosphoinositide dependent protein kinase-1
MESICNYCKTSGSQLLQCGGCHAVRYCDTECQKKDWKLHKSNCAFVKAKESNITEVMPTTPPTPEENSNESKIPKSASKPEDYIQVKQVGLGNFSEIFLARHKETGGEFAMKIIPKLKLKSLHKESDVIMEKHCLKKLEGFDHVIKLYDTFQDELNLYMIMEMVPGGELWDLTKNFGLKGRGLIKYFSALMIKDVELLHSKGIVHRDLKPENIMLTRDKKIKFVDFGTARDMLQPEIKGSGNSAKGKRVYEHFVGTPQYMPPEAIRNRGSGYKSDIFALGCIIYQFFTGHPPFLGGSEYLVFTKTLNEKALYYDFIFDEESKGLIEIMIDKDVEKRTTLEDVKKHSFFADIDWNNIPSYEEFRKKMTKEELYLENIKHKVMEIKDATPKILEQAIENFQKQLTETQDFDVPTKEKLLKRLHLMYKQSISHHSIEHFEHGI